MNKVDMVNELSVRTGASKKDSGIFYDTFIQLLKESVAEGKPINLQGLGKFRYSRRPERVGRNPLTGESIDVPEKTYVSFSVAWKLKQAVADVAVLSDESDDHDDE